MTRGPEDLLWGLGAGCEGAMDVVLVRVDAANGWQPLAEFMTALAAQRPAAAAIVVESNEVRVPAGRVYCPLRPRPARKPMPPT